MLLRVDADGELNVGELTKVFGALNVQAKNDEIAALFKELDKST
jgi:Ca2+-binding EF-hand superfamily protein